MRTLLSFLAAAVIAAPVAVAAAQPANADSDSIVVEGQKHQKQQIRDLVRSLTPAPFDSQLGRFQYPICPLAVGLPAAQNVAVAARIRQVAAASGVPVAGPKCSSANLFVVVARDKATMIGLLRRKVPGLVDGIYRRDLEALSRSPSPAAVWHITDELDENGLERLDSGLGYKFVETTSASRMSRPSFPHFLGAVVLIELDALRGATPRQVADYAAMRALAPIDSISLMRKGGGNPDPQPPARSILTLLDGRPAQQAEASVTWWDFAFLKALYATDNQRMASIQRGRMQSHIAQTLAEVPDDEK